MEQRTDEAFRYCQTLARQHYENFPVASILLPRHLRKHLAAIYAFARIADDFADEGNVSQELRLQKLDDWEKQLIASYRGSADHPVFVALSETVSEFDIPMPLFQRLLKAFRSDVVTTRYKTWHDVLDYCTNSANPVGRILLLLFRYNDEERAHYSDAICTALQLTNFWQDISVDLGKGRIYIPKEDIDFYGCSEDDIVQKLFSERTLLLMQEMVQRTEQLFQKGLPLVSMLKYPLRWEIGLTWSGGMEILSMIKKMNYNTFQKRPVLSMSQMFPLLFRSFFM